MRKDISVLVVDDMAVMRRIVRNLLVDVGFAEDNIKESEDGDKALAQLRSQDFDLVITDWNMPVMQGIDLLREIRKDPVLKDKPVLMVTAEAKKEQIVEAAQAGVNQYIVKPFNANTLNEKIKRIYAD